MSIDELGLSKYTVSTLKRNGIYTVEQIASMSYRQIYLLRFIGKKSLEEILSKCADMGINIKYERIP